jgi:hypothetical protein
MDRNTGISPWPSICRVLGGSPVEMTLMRRGDPLADDAMPVSSSTGLSKGAMAGIAVRVASSVNQVLILKVGAVAAVAALLALGFFWLRRRKR